MDTLYKVTGSGVSQTITEGMNIMQSCLVGVMGNGMMGLLTDRIMQTINEKQLVASENAQDRFNAMQSELIIAYHKVIRPCWSVTIKSKLFDVNRMYEIYIKTIPIVL